MTTKKSEIAKSKKAPAKKVGAIADKGEQKAELKEVVLDIEAPEVVEAPKKAKAPKIGRIFMKEKLMINLPGAFGKGGCLKLYKRKAIIDRPEDVALVVQYADPATYDVIG